MTRQAFNMALLQRPFSVALAFVILLIFTMRVEAALSSNRYLFVVETSKSMQSRTDGVRRVVVDLLGSGMHGQLQAGDTVGLWTFNKELRAGTFPLQDWAPDRRDVLSSRVLTFLRAQKWEKSASWSTVMPTLNQVIQKSDLLTVVVISSGDEKISGTLFDDQIKKQFKLWRDQQDKAHMPLLTVFRARKGTITDCSVTPVPFPVDLPPLPKEYVVVPEKPRPPAPAPPPPRKVEPLIVSGHKSTPTTPAPITPAPIASEPKPVLTNTTTANTATTNTVAPNTIAANFANTVTANTVTSAPDLNAAQVEPTPGFAVEKLVPDFPEPIRSEPATTRPVTAPPVKALAASVPTNSAALATTTTPTSPAPAQAAPAQAAPAVVPPAPTPVPVAVPAVASAGSLLPGQKVFARELAPSSPKPSTSVAATEAAISVSATGGRNGLYWAGCAAAGLAVGLYLVFARRHRAPDQLSLITRSLERDRK